MASIKEQQFVLKNSEEVLIKTFDGQDGQAMITFRSQLGHESTNTFHYPNMPLPSLEESSKFYQEQFEHPVNLGFGAFLENVLIGSIGLRVPRHDHPWAKHVGEFGMGILKDYWGQGLGKKFLEIQEEYAKSIELTRIQASVRTFNERGVKLYTNFGFQIEGTMKNTALIDDKYYDEYSIAKTLELRSL